MPSLIERAVNAVGAKAVYDALSEKERQVARYVWEANARAEQLPPPGDWLVWLMLAGRGFGKTRAGAEFVRREVESGRAKRIALVAQTPADVRDVLVEGESGLLPISPPGTKPKYETSKRRITWPNGAVALAFSSYDPDQLRGPQFDLAWCDELRAWAYPRETWDNLMLALRLGDHPRCVVTTTPSPIQVIRELVKSPTTVVSRGSTFDNKANLPQSFFDQVVSRYQGTTLGRQEIYAEILEDVPGAPWQRALINYESAPDLERVVVAVDPAVTSKESSDETGIVVAGCTGSGKDVRYWVLADDSLRAGPDKWARAVINGYREYKADRIIGEVNNGGDLVEMTLRTIDQSIPYKAVHASRGKAIRAEPIVALYEQGKVKHAKPFPDLEDQMCTWTPDSGMKSPDRMDALVWALTELSNQGDVRLRFL